MGRNATAEALENLVKAIKSNIEDVTITNKREDVCYTKFMINLQYISEEIEQAEKVIKELGK